MKLGFTGTQRGMTDKQKDRLRAMIFLFQPTEFHHGDCIGADAEAHKIAVAMKVEPIIHPPSDSKKRAFCKEGRILTPKPYGIRNRDIVIACNFLVGMPAEAQEVLRSGTWSTLRFAMDVKKDFFVIYPDGRSSFNHF